MKDLVHLPVLRSLFLLMWLTPVAGAADLKLQRGDRVVFLGDGLIEQEQYFGWLELMMTTAFPDQHVTFRNLGWNADTPDGASRFGLSLLQAGREPEDEGWKQLQKQLELTKPTVLVLGYGMASALEGELAGLDRFVSDYQRLLQTAQTIEPDVRFLFLSPLQRLDPDHPQAAMLASYSDAIRQLADMSDSPFVDLSDCAKHSDLRKDPIHLNGDGYRELAQQVQKSLQWDAAAWRESPQAETLREVILRKNVWWFHRSRPANMAYVFGFRKHEQGQNAAEIPRFDGLIETEEAKIARLRSLQPTAVAAGEPRVESNYAKFREQATPEFTVAEGWQVTLWAENPQLNKPIQINFDPQGRLWVASSEAYPMIEVGQAAPDKIVVLEDSDDDGRADQSTVFAEGLLIPTGVEPGDGGAYVAQSTDLLFLKDLDGDGKADTKRRVLSGFGTEDTHHNLHTLTWGPDGRLYMNQSVYTRTNTETPRGVVRLKAGGGFRYNTDTMRMQIFFRGLWNSWGHQFNEFGQSFFSDGAGFEGIGYAFPGAVFNPTPNARRQLELISPGSYPKFASLEIVSGKSYPEDWQGSIVTCDFRANRVTRFSLQQQGAGYLTEQQDDLLRTSASTFRPIDVKQGPDGALYIADWSNPIINHGEVDFRDERRDRWHGRIWRVRWKGAEPKAKVDLRQLATEELLDNLIRDDAYTRRQSRRVLIEREQIEPQLDEWMMRHDDQGSRLQGMWLYQALGSLQKLPTDVLEGDDGRMRAAAVRVLADFADPASDQPEQLDWQAASQLLAPRVVDEHPQVRLEAVRALGKIGTAEAASLALESLSLPQDRFLEFALATTVQDAAGPLMQAIDSGDWLKSSANRQQQLSFVLTAIDPARAGAFLANYLQEHPLAQDGSGPWIELIGTAGGKTELRQLYDQVVSGGFDSQATVKALDALRQAARLRRLRPEDATTGLGSLLAADEEATQRAAAQLAGTWKLTNQVGRLATIAADTDSSLPLRLTAIEAIGEIGGKQSTEALFTLTAAEFSVSIRRRAVVALASLAPGRTPSAFLALLEEMETEEEALELWRQLLSVQRMGKVLAANLSADGLSQVAARAGVRVCRDGGRDEPELLAALLPLADMTLTAEALTPQRMEELIQRVTTDGNPAAGERIYLRRELNCASCHAIGGVGGKVGPDMTSLGASAPLDYIIESLFDPDAKIKEGFHAVTVLTEDGMIVNGVEGESTDNELVLRDANNQIVRIPQADVTVKKAGKSLMPTGVIDRLPISEQVDLISFLARLGKPGAFDASQGGVARAYEILAGTHRLEQQGVGPIISGERTEAWQPVMSRVNGDVSRETMAKLTAQPRNIALVNVYLRTRVKVARDGEVTLSLDGPASADLWIDGEPLEGTTSFTADLKEGEHTVLVRLDARALPENFRLRSEDLQFLAE